MTRLEILSGPGALPILREAIAEAISTSVTGPKEKSGSEELNLEIRLSAITPKGEGGAGNS